MDKKQSASTWAAVGGLAIGALATFPFQLAPPSLSILPVSPLLMAALSYFAVRYLMRQNRPIPFFKKAGIGILTGAIFVGMYTIIGGILYGSEWWEWAAVGLFFGLAGSIPIGGAWGWAVGIFAERVALGTIRPITNVKIVALTGILLLSFLCLPGAIWWWKVAPH